MAVQYIEMIPKEITVKQNGSSKKSGDVTAGLIVSWVRPNEMANIVTGEINGIELQSGEKYSTFPLESPEDLIKNQIIKTKVIGRSVIKAEVIVAHAPGVLHKVFATLFGTAVGLISISNPFASALVGLGKSEMQDAIKMNHVVSLGLGFYRFDADVVVNEVNISLITKSAITEIVRTDDLGIPIPDLNDQVTELLAAGENNGNVILTLNQIEI